MQNDGGSLHLPRGWAERECGYHNAGTGNAIALFSMGDTSANPIACGTFAGIPIRWTTAAWRLKPEKAPISEQSSLL